MAGKKGTVLVVEPWSIPREGASRILERAYNVEEASSAHIAQGVLEKRRQHLSLVVIGLGRLEGGQIVVDVAQEFGIPVLLMTLPGDAVLDNLTAFNADDISADEFLAVVEKSITQGKK